MAKELLAPDYIFEASWEVCNKVGGIYTVLSTRAKTLQEAFKDKVFFIGPDFWAGKENPLFSENENLCAAWREHALKKDGLIQNWYHYEEIKIGDTPTVLFHFPIASWHKQNYGSIMLHGHSHGAFTEGKGKILDVGLDSSFNLYGNHKFFTEDNIIEYMKLREKKVVDHHAER